MGEYRNEAAEELRGLKEQLESKQNQVSQLQIQITTAQKEMCFETEWIQELIANPEENEDNDDDDSGRHLLRKRKRREGEHIQPVPVSKKRKSEKRESIITGGLKKFKKSD